MESMWAPIDKGEIVAGNSLDVIETIESLEEGT